MAAALTRSASVTDSPILTGTDALSSSMGVAGDRVCFPTSGFSHTISFSLPENIHFHFCLCCLVSYYFTYYDEALSN